MPNTWNTEEQGYTTCKHCGTVYILTVTRLPAKDHDSFNCEFCGNQIGKWNDTFSRKYSLKNNNSNQQKTG